MRRYDSQINKSPIIKNNHKSQTIYRSTNFAGQASVLNNPEKNSFPSFIIVGFLNYITMFLSLFYNFFFFFAQNKLFIFNKISIKKISLENFLYQLNDIIQALVKINKKIFLVKLYFY